jgi:hypothetical protein
MDCSVGSCGQKLLSINGPGTFDVPVKQNDRMWTKYVYVYCSSTQ